jgi:hypothetical protein
MLRLPLKVADIMRDFKPRWFVAGGWAIDLYLEKVTRPHNDIEIAIFRKDQLALHNYLKGWRLQKVVQGKLMAWHEDESLELPIHEIHGFNEASDPQQIEVLLNETDGNEWIYRRNEKVRRPMAKCHLVSKEGVKFLCPEVVLLYKSKNPNDKDEQDFAGTIKHFDAERRGWLRDAIAVCDAGHHWLHRL